MIITYRTDDNGTNEIVHKGDSPQPHLENTAWVETERVSVTLTCDRWNIAEKRVEPMTKAQFLAAHRPQRWEIVDRIAIELKATDEFTADWYRDQPTSAQDRADWALYRHALRRLSDVKDAAAMIAAWPDRPDSVDPIPDLRARSAPA